MPARVHARTATVPARSPPMDGEMDGSKHKPPPQRRAPRRRSEKPSSRSTAIVATPERRTTSTRIVGNRERDDEGDSVVRFGDRTEQRRRPSRIASERTTGRSQSRGRSVRAADVRRDMNRSDPPPPKESQKDLQKRVLNYVGRTSQTISPTKNSSFNSNLSGGKSVSSMPASPTRRSAASNPNLDNLEGKSFRLTVPASMPSSVSSSVPSRGDSRQDSRTSNRSNPPPPPPKRKSTLLREGRRESQEGNKSIDSQNTDLTNSTCPSTEHHSSNESSLPSSHGHGYSRSLPASSHGNSHLLRDDNGRPSREDRSGRYRPLAREDAGTTLTLWEDPKRKESGDRLMREDQIRNSYSAVRSSAREEPTRKSYSEDQRETDRPSKRETIGPSKWKISAVDEDEQLRESRMKRQSSMFSVVDDLEELKQDFDLNPTRSQSRSRSCLKKRSSMGEDREEPGRKSYSEGQRGGGGHCSDRPEPRRRSSSFDDLADELVEEELELARNQSRSRSSLKKRSQSVGREQPASRLSRDLGEVTQVPLAGGDGDGGRYRGRRSESRSSSRIESRSSSRMSSRSGRSSSRGGFDERSASRGGFDERSASKDRFGRSASRGRSSKFDERSASRDRFGARSQSRSRSYQQTNIKDVLPKDNLEGSRHADPPAAGRSMSRSRARSRAQSRSRLSDSGSPEDSSLRRQRSKSRNRGRSQDPQADRYQDSYSSRQSNQSQEEPLLNHPQPDAPPNGAGNEINLVIDAQGHGTFHIATKGLSNATSKKSQKHLTFDIHIDEASQRYLIHTSMGRLDRIRNIHPGMNILRTLSYWNGLQKRRYGNHGEVVRGGQLGIVAKNRTNLVMMTLMGEYSHRAWEYDDVFQRELERFVEDALQFHLCLNGDGAQLGDGTSPTSDGRMGISRAASTKLLGKVLQKVIRD